MSYETPVLFIIFNRPETVSAVFETIREARPRRLYIAADGPRPDVESDSVRCAQARSVADLVDWDCDLRLRFRDENLGPMHAQVDAINWFFESEEEGVILEDDCLPSVQFFSFCEELLAKYRNDERVFMISGNNFQPEGFSCRDSYYFSIHTHVWGWATWKRVWDLYDQFLLTWPDFKERKGLERMNLPKGSEAYWRDIFESIYGGEYPRGWDYRFTYTCWKENCVSIIPRVNLVSNIGHGEDGTNCRDENSPFAALQVGRLDWPLKHPDVIVTNTRADDDTSARMFHKHSILERIANRLKPKMR